MKDIICDGITRIEFDGYGEHSSSIEIFISSFREVGDEIEIETPVKLDGIGRGWMGDLFVHIRGISIKDVDKRTDEEHIARDVLCIRCHLNSEQGEAATWTYTFLKD